ncbi:peptidylprolyl isomerase [bacterium]|nr:peptidylprolyl isomerase [bacterium]
MVRMLSTWGIWIGVAFAGAQETTPEVTVNGQAISSAEVDAAFARTSLAKQPLTDEQRSVYRGHVINLLIDGTLVKQFLTEKGIKSDPALVDRHLADFEALLKEKGNTLDKFLAENQATSEQMKQEVNDLYQWFEYVDGESSDANLKKYFEQNRGTFDGSQVRARHIMAELPPHASPEQKKKARMKLEQIRAQLAAGTDFASLAQQHSDCQSKKQGGDVGYFPRKGKVTEAFAACAFELPPNQISDIIESEYGMHLIQVTDRRPGQEVAFQTVAEDVRSMFAADLRSEIIQQMRDKADIRLASPAAVASDPSEPAVRR